MTRTIVYKGVAITGTELKEYGEGTWEIKFSIRRGTLTACDTTWEHMVNVMINYIDTIAR